MKATESRKLVIAARALTLVVSSMTATAQMPPQTTTPDRVESSRLGPLTFKDGVPDKAPAQKLFDEIGHVLRQDLETGRDRVGEVRLRESE
jgi:hypothetical protein